MSVLVVGLNHQSAEVELLERAVVGTSDRKELLASLLAGSHVGEAVVLSTCNRVELYAGVSAFHGGLHDVGSVLADRIGIDLTELAGSLYVHYADEAVRHLFSVTSGLNSMVIGESQILGQMRQAYNAAAELGAPGRLLHELMQQALRVGKRVHADTGIDRAGQSVVSRALEVGARATGGLEGKSALVIGAGSMGALAAATLQRAGVGSLTVANRSGIRAARLAREIDPNERQARVVRLDQLAEVLPTADIIVSATASATPVLTADMLIAADSARTGQGFESPQVHQTNLRLVVDLAIPRDVEPAVADLPGCHLVDIASLGSALAAECPQSAGVGADVAAAEAIISEEVGAFLAWQRSVDVTPTVAALRARADEVVGVELTRLAGRLPQLDDHTRREVERSVRRVVATLLHVPTVRVKELASSPDGQAYASALRELFGLNPTEATVPDVVAVRPSGDPMQPSPQVIDALAAGPAPAGRDGKLEANG